MSPDDDRITPREFTKAVMDLQSLLTTLHDGHSKLADMRHVSLRNTLDRLEEGMRTLSTTFDDHQDEDRLVEKRVTLIEEWQKRLIWIVLAIIPSSITVWESVKKFLFK